MGLFYDAAVAWENLLNKRYIFIVAHKCKKTEIELSFNNEDFPHLAGMQYAKDVDFGLNKAEYYGELLVPAILNRALESKKIEQSRNWNKISGRLKAIINLQNTFDGDFQLYRFNKNKVRGYSEIQAKYVIKSVITDEIYFVFFDKEENRFYCKSAFRKEITDYGENQTRLIMLKKLKVIDDSPLLLYKKDSYLDDNEDLDKKS